MFKKLFLAVLLALSLAVLPAAAAGPVKIQINGARLATDVDPVIIDGRTLVPVRAIAEGFGAEVGWDGASRQVTVKKSGNTVILTIDNTNYTKNGQTLKMDVPAQIVSDRTMVPVRVVSESLDAQVDWNGETRTVIINKQEEDNGLTPEQVLEKSLTATAGLDGTRFKGTIEANTGVGDPVRIAIEGAAKAGATRLKMSGNPPEGPITMEMWTNGKVFLVNDGGGWVENESFSFVLLDDVHDMIGDQYPAAVMKRIKEMGGIISFTANSAESCGVRATIDADKLLAETPPEESGFPDLKRKLVCDLTIRKADFVIQKFELTGEYIVEDVKTGYTGSVDLYDFNQVDSVPKP
jgi:hypothetical protein